MRDEVRMTTLGMQGKRRAMGPSRPGTALSRQAVPAGMNPNSCDSTRVGICRVAAL